MDTLLSAAHLRRELSEEQFRALVDPANTGKVREFCDKLVVLLTEMTILGKTYGIRRLESPVEQSFHSAAGHTHLVSTNMSLNNLNGMLVGAHCREDDVRHILRYQDRIPRELRSKTILFTGWQDGLGRIAKIYYKPQVGLWHKGWHRLDCLSGNNYVLAYRQS